LWHVGRVSHTSLQPKEGAPIAPSAICAEAQTYIPAAGGGGGGEARPASEPRELMFTEMSEIVRTFAAAARLALDDAGFDGVEIHAANGYLLDQFLKSTANQRTDTYGGDIEGRCRLPLEVIRAVVKAAGGGARVGLRISPVSPANGIGTDPEAQPLFEHLLREAGSSQLAYVHVVEGATGGARELPQAFDYKALCAAWRDGGAQGAWMVNNGYNAEMAEQALIDGPAELVSFGRPFIANPDLSARMERGAALNEFDRATLYGGGEEGYLDYPALPAEA
ncbi:MAG: alkene reductase, partial [Ottowia sp.]|nr:alkene reductase [Ottowia sp.]